MRVSRGTARVIFVAAAVGTLAALIGWLMSRRTHERPSRVGIIGAGVAGATLARELHDAGIPFVVVEAAPNVGGRLRSAAPLTPGAPVLELGANWLHNTGRGDEFGELAVNTIGLRTTVDDIDDYTFYEGGGRQIPNDQAEAAFSRAEQALATVIKFRESSGSTCSVQDALQHLRIWIQPSQLDKAAMALLVDASYGAPLSALSVQDLHEESFPSTASSVVRFARKTATARVDTLPGNRSELFVTDPRGYRQFVVWHLQKAGIGDPSLSGDTLRLNSRVHTVVHGDRDASYVELADGSRINASHIVSTVSLSVLSSSQISFRPPLSGSVTTAMRNVGMGRFTKLFVAFKDAVFTQADATHLVPVNAGEGNWYEAVNLNKEGLFPGSNTVLLLTADPLATDLLGMSEAARVKSALEFLSFSSVRTLEPKDVVGAVMSGWADDDDFLGSFSFWKAGASVEEVDTISKPIGNLFFAGEAYDVEDRGSVRGAWKSAMSIAKKLR